MVSTRRFVCALVFTVGLGPSACTPRSHAVPTTDRSNGEIPLVHAAHTATPPVIDGDLRDAIWAHAESTGAFVSPGNGHPDPQSHVNARARFAWDAYALYAAVEVDDPNPVTPFHAADIDPHLWERASAVEFMIQPGDPGDNRDYYEVQIDTAGAVWDTYFDDYNRPIADAPGGRTFGHQEWRSNVRQASRVHTGVGYVLEVALPWAPIAGVRTAVPPHASDTWRLNVYSFRDGQREAMAWSPLLGQGNFHRATRFGRVVFAP